jgi:predicted O-methyltransferase YrrM
MTQPVWTDIDTHFEALFVGADTALEGALARSAAASLPAIHVSALQGKLLHLLARLAGARRILEVGTLGGYSTIWLARALPADGRLITLELDPGRADVARANLQDAGLAAQVEVRVGPAAASLSALAQQAPEPFDVVFVDADKRGTPGYLEQALPLLRPGGLLILDNVVRGGGILDPAHPDADVQGMRAGLAWMAAHPRLDTTALQTVGAKGWDGLALALVRG